MKKINDFFNKLNQKNKTSSETSEVINLDKSNSQATSADKDDAILDLSEALNKSFLSTNNITIYQTLSQNIRILAFVGLLHVNCDRCTYNLIIIYK